jgi:leucyl-tRNA synthetase
MYIGGAEHATLHLMYARYFVKALRDMGLLQFNEPFTRLYHQGTVLGPDGVKMSKSRGNVIAPDDVVGRYGADSVRCYLMFMGPFDQGGPWSHDSIQGVARFMNRVWTLVQDFLEPGDGKRRVDIGAAVERLRHKMIVRVGEDYEDLHFNTALASLMEYVNELNKAREAEPLVMRDPRFAAAIDTLLVLLAPMAPHISEELWSATGHQDSVHDQSWPEYDPLLIVDDMLTVVVQVNGKVRDKLEVASDISEDELRSLAWKSAKVQAASDGHDPKKVIYVPGRLINFVV